MAGVLSVAAKPVSVEANGPFDPIVPSAFLEGDGVLDGDWDDAANLSSRSVLHRLNDQLRSVSCQMRLYSFLRFQTI